MRKSYIGQPYYGSNRSARIFTSRKIAKEKSKSVGGGSVHQIGSGRMYVVKPTGKKYYLK